MFYTWSTVFWAFLPVKGLRQAASSLHFIAANCTLYHFLYICDSSVIACPMLLSPSIMLTHPKKNHFRKIAHRFQIQAFLSSVKLTIKLLPLFEWATRGELLPTSGFNQMNSCQEAKSEFLFVAHINLHLLPTSLFPLRPTQD